MSRLGSSLNVKLGTAVALASCHLQQDLDRRLERLTEGRSLLDPKVTCANGTPTSLFCPPSQQGHCCGRCPRALNLLPLLGRAHVFSEPPCLPEQPWALAGCVWTFGARLCPR